MTDKVNLNWYEIALASSVGCRRHVEALRAGRQDKHGFTGDGWGIHIEGAAGEMAFAKHLGWYWDGSVNTMHAGDFDKIQIRTRSRDDYELIVRRDDPDGDLYVLVVGKAPTYRIVGCIFGRDAKRQEWLATHGDRSPAYFVPAKHLRPVSEVISNR